MKFSLLVESLESFQYQIPEDKEQLLFDFYMFEFLEKGPNTRLGTPVSYTEGFLAKDDEINQTLRRIREVILPYLKKHLLEAVKVAIEAELENLNISNTKEDADTIVWAKKELNKFTEKAFIGRAKEIFFPQIHWNAKFGGSAWANVCEAWLKLYDCPDNERYIWIDHIYDIQHNTDTVFNKLSEYYSEGYGWIKDALELKTNTKTPWELWINCSDSMKELANEVLVFKGFTGESKSEQVAFGPLNFYRNSAKKIRKAVLDKDINKIKELNAEYPISTSLRTELLSAAIDKVRSIKVCKTLFDLGFTLNKRLAIFYIIKYQKDYSDMAELIAARVFGTSVYGLKHR